MCVLACICVLAFICLPLFLLVVISCTAYCKSINKIEKKKPEKAGGDFELSLALKKILPYQQVIVYIFGLVSLSSKNKTLTLA